ncbi:hypothetical protein Droror1_Dr00025486 [Drosera rotundifolia]
MTPPSPPTPRNPNRRSSHTPKRRPVPTTSSASSSSPSSSIASLLLEPSPNFFPSASELLQLVAAIVVAVAVAVGCHYAVSSIGRGPRPFCDSDSEFHDSCEPCPRNGQCYNGNLECAPGYRKYGRSCVQDGVINAAAEKISEWVENRLCQEYALFLCDGKGIVWVSEDKLNNDLDLVWERGTIGLDNTSYVYAREKALENINAMLDSRMNDRRIKELKCPDNLAEKYKKITCRFRQWLAKHALILTPVSALLVSCILLLLRVRRRCYLSKRAEQLYQQVCEILEERALMSNNPNGGEPWLVSSRLRDHLLSRRERKDPVLWKKVQELVDEDSRVDRYPKIVKGEQKVVWEWQVEGSLSSSSKRKKPAVDNTNSGAPTSIFSFKKVR